MITPAYSMTATERVLPKLALDFTTASLDPRITFTRSGATATVVNSNGYVVSVSADTPRFDYNPTTLVCRGLLIEESRTNLIASSSDYANAFWGKNGVTVTANAVNGPDNTLSADLLTGTGGGCRIDTTVAFGAGSTISMSWFIKKKTADVVQTEINTFGGANPTAGGQIQYTFSTNTAVVVGGTFTNVTSTVYPNGWVRVTGTFASSASHTNGIIYQYAASGWAVTGETYLWGVQIEVGAFVTSFIPTTTASVTRNADVATMTGTNFSDWYNAVEGAFQITCQSNRYGVGNAAVGLCVSDGTNPNVMLTPQMLSNNVRTCVVTNSNVDTVILTSQSTTYPTANITTSFGYKVNNFAGARGGAFLQTDTSSNVPACDRMFIGSYNATTGAQFLNGTVAKINYWPQRVTNAEVQSFSKG